MQCQVCGYEIIDGECRCFFKNTCKTCGTGIVYVIGKTKGREKDMAEARLPSWKIMQKINER